MAEQKRFPYDWISIVPKKDGGRLYYGVYGHDIYPSSSVLAGQTRNIFLESFDTLEDAEKNYPEAEISHPFLEPKNTFDHLPDSPDFPEDYF